MSAHTEVRFVCDRCRCIGNGGAEFGANGGLGLRLPLGWWNEYGDPRSDGRNILAQLCDRCSAKRQRAEAHGGKAVLEFYNEIAAEKKVWP